MSRSRRVQRVHLSLPVTARFGANKAAWYTQETKAVVPPAALAASTKIKGTNTFDMNLGAGLKFGNLQIDAVLANDFPHNLPYFISGATTANMFSKVTATYPW